MPRKLFFVGTLVQLFRLGIGVAMIRIALVSFCLAACSGSDDKVKVDSALNGDAPQLADAPGLADAPAGVDADQEQSIHGCLSTSATDLSGMANVTITDLSAWSFGHGACIAVDSGTVVRWQAQSFNSHPLVGGEVPNQDAASVITIAGPGSGNTPIDVTFSSPGVYPYFCGNHSSMNGVVYVQ